MYNSQLVSTVVMKYHRKPTMTGVPWHSLQNRVLNKSYYIIFMYWVLYTIYVL